jgi:hypothetical protein
MLGKRATHVEEEMVFEMQLLSITRGTADIPAQMTSVFRAEKEGGGWDESVPEIRKRFFDDPHGENLVAQKAATFMRALLLGAVVPQVTEQLAADDPELAQAILALEAAAGETLQGLTVRDVGEMLLPLGV